MKLETRTVSRLNLLQQSDPLGRALHRRVHTSWTWVAGEKLHARVNEHKAKALRWSTTVEPAKDEALDKCRLRRRSFARAFTPVRFFRPARPLVCGGLPHRLATLLSLLTLHVREPHGYQSL